jgi:DNA (cytosine-5)-methyltransferase 1
MGNAGDRGMMRYLSVCSGIEAATVAWHPLDWKPVAFSEIEKFPSAVLAHHYPDVPNLGDLTKFKDWNHESIDLLAGGTPCQAFSVAGLRKGLDDPRGNLTLTFLALASRARPRWIVWENVPGVLSDKTNAFGQFLAGLAELGYGCAYRVLDAQHFGVPQRRRRVFVVGYLGNWQRAAAVLFEPESMRGDSPPRRQSREAVAGTITRGTFDGSASGGDGREGSLIAHTLKGEGFDASEDGTGRGTPLVPIAFSSKDSGGDASDIAPTLRAGGHAKSHANGGVMPAVAFHENQRGEVSLCETAGALNKGGGKPGQGYQAIAFHNRQDPDVSGEIASPIGAKDNGLGVGITIHGTNKTVSTASITDVCGSLRTKPPGSQENSSTTAVMQGMSVRRLTPRECERLQGFPDDYTLIPVGKNKKPAPDGPRYKALGNSMAVPVMRWIGRRIDFVDQIPE